MITGLGMATLTCRHMHTNNNILILCHLCHLLSVITTAKFIHTLLLLHLYHSITYNCPQYHLLLSSVSQYHLLLTLYPCIRVSMTTEPVYNGPLSCQHITILAPLIL